MGDQLMGFPTPLEVFGESRSAQAKSKTRKPPPVNNGSAAGSPVFHQGAYYQPPPVHPQQQQYQQQQQQQQYYQQQQQQQPRSQSSQYYGQVPQYQERPQQIQQQPPPQLPLASTRHSSQHSLGSSYSNPSNSSLPYRAPVAPQQQQPPASKKEIFDSLDRNRSGSLSFQELSRLLENKDGVKFLVTLSSSIFKLFDTDGSGSLSYNEFSRLTDCLERWKLCFIMADKNTSNSLSFSEFQDAVQVLGYRLSTDTALSVFQNFSRLNLDMRFDLFIEACVYLISVTRVFKKYDPQGNGVAVVQFENFVDEVLKLKYK